MIDDIVKITANSQGELIKQWNDYMRHAKFVGRYQSRSILYRNLKDNTYSYYLFFNAAQSNKVSISKYR